MRGLARNLYRKVVAAMPDRTAVGVTALRASRRWPELETPRRFTDKIHYRKLNDRDARLPVLVDKLRVKDWVKQQLGEEWVIPTIWSNDKIDVATIADLPTPCVLKANHASNCTIFLKAGNNPVQAAEVANSWMHLDFGHLYREWAYTEVPRRILAEPFIGGDVSPDDYKFFVFDGRVHMIQVDAGRFSNHTRNFYTASWEPIALRMMYDNGPTVSQPKHLEMMVRAAERLGSGISFGRIDFYDLATGPKFGEFTAYPGAGLEACDPDSYDFTLGELWKL